MANAKIIARWTLTSVVLKLRSVASKTHYCIDEH